MKKGAILLITLLLTALATSADSSHIDSPQHHDYPQGSSAKMGNMQSNDPIYEHGEELPFDHSSYLNHIDKDKDGFVTFEEH